MALPLDPKGQHIQKLMDSTWRVADKETQEKFNKKADRTDIISIILCAVLGLFIGMIAFTDHNPAVHVMGVMSSLYFGWLIFGVCKHRRIRKSGELVIHDAIVYIGVPRGKSHINIIIWKDGENLVKQSVDFNITMAFSKTGDHVLIGRVTTQDDYHLIANLSAKR